MHRSYPARMVMLAASPRAPGALPCLRACTRCGGPAGRLPENIGVSIAGQVLDELLSVVIRSPASLVADMTATVSCD